MNRVLHACGDVANPQEFSVVFMTRAVQRLDAFMGTAGAKKSASLFHRVWQDKLRISRFAQRILLQDDDYDETALDGEEDTPILPDESRMLFENQRSAKMSVDEYLYYSESRKVTLNKLVKHKNNGHVCFQIVEGTVEECLTRRYGSLQTPDRPVTPLEYVRGLHSFLSRHNDAGTTAVPISLVQEAWRGFLIDTSTSILSQFPNKAAPKEEFLTLFARHVCGQCDCEWSQFSLAVFSEVLDEEGSVYRLKKVQ